MPTGIPKAGHRKTHPLPRFVQMSARGATTALCAYLARAETARSVGRRTAALRNARVLAEALRTSLAPRRFASIPVTPFAVSNGAPDDEESDS